MLTKVMEAKIFVNGKVERKKVHAPAKRRYAENAVEMFLEDVSTHLEKQYPEKQFRMIEIGFGKFNFVENQGEPA